MTRSIIIAILISFTCGYASSQQPAPGDIVQTCRFSEAYRRDGWTIPGLDGAKAKNPRVKYGGTPGVFVTVLRPGKVETYIPEIWCSRDNPGRLEIENAPIEILDMWAFDFNGRVFAYRISYGEEAINNGKRSRLGAASVIFFYDIDSSGHFTIIKAPNMRAGEPILPFIPNWAGGAGPHQ